MMTSDIERYPNPENGQNKVSMVFLECMTAVQGEAGTNIVSLPLESAFFVCMMEDGTYSQVGISINPDKEDYQELKARAVYGIEHTNVLKDVDDDEIMIIETCITDGEKFENAIRLSGNPEYQNGTCAIGLSKRCGPFTIHGVIGKFDPVDSMTPIQRGEYIAECIKRVTQSREARN